MSVKISLTGSRQVTLNPPSVPVPVVVFFVVLETSSAIEAFVVPERQILFAIIASQWASQGQGQGVRAYVRACVCGHTFSSGCSQSITVIHKSAMPSVSQQSAVLTKEAGQTTDSMLVVESCSIHVRTQLECPC